MCFLLKEPKRIFRPSPFDPVTDSVSGWNLPMPGVLLIHICGVKKKQKPCQVIYFMQISEICYFFINNNNNMKTIYIIFDKTVTVIVRFL